LRRAGLIVVNPPFGLIDEARALMPWLTKLLTRAGKGAHVVEWLTPPA
jgi:23S rRNA A2030 N6-methylase RlmJ